MAFKLINTAPKDGTVIIGLMLSYVDGVTSTMTKCKYSGEFWIKDDGTEEKIPDPTHWCELPKESE